jgi:hypothetical protein
LDWPYPLTCPHKIVQPQEGTPSFTENAWNGQGGGGWGGGGKRNHIKRKADFVLCCEFLLVCFACLSRATKLLFHRLTLSWAHSFDLKAGPLHAPNRCGAHIGVAEVGCLRPTLCRSWTSWSCTRIPVSDLSYCNFSCNFNQRLQDTPHAAPLLSRCAWNCTAISENQPLIGEGFRKDELSSLFWVAQKLFTITFFQK